MKTLRLRGLVLVMAALLPAAAFASPTVNTLGGDTRVQLSADLVGALTSLGVSVKASYPARLRGASASFPIPGGELDLGTLKGEVDHAGGLTLRAGATEVNLSSYTIDTTGAAPVLTGLVKVNDSVLGRLPLFDITLVSAPVVRGLHARAGSVQLDNVRLTLNDEAAVALNAVFNVSAFQAGLPVGTARVQYHLRQVMVFLNAFTLNKPEVFINHSGSKFNAEGELTDEATGKFIGEQLVALRTLAERVKPR